VSFKKKGEGHRRKRKRGMLEEISLNRAVKTSEHNMVKLKQSHSRGKRNHRNGSSLQHLKQRIYNLPSLAISNQTTTIASHLNSITSLHIKINSLLNSKSPDHQSIYLSTTKEEMICLATDSNPTTKGVSHSSLLKAIPIKDPSPPILCLNLPNTLQTIRTSPL
jgi:hypothetical protein